MRKKMIVLAACMMATAACLAQKADGGISAQMLSDIEKSYAGGAQSKAPSTTWPRTSPIRAR